MLQPLTRSAQFTFSSLDGTYRQALCLATLEAEKLEFPQTVPAS